jgi:hypothetical protein
MKRRTRRKVVVFVVVMLVFFTSSVQVKKPVGITNSVFSSSFIQYWYAMDWNEDRWIEELTMLNNIGVEELILQTIADTKNKFTVYQTEMDGYTSNDMDMVETVLSAADSVGIRVRIGLGFSEDWWSKNAADRDWLMSEAGENKNIFNEIITKYGKHPSLGGWYIPHEFCQLTAVTEGHQANLNSFLKEISREIKSRSDRDIMISPFYNSKFSWVMSPKGWSQMVENALRDTEIDILALQDGIGVRHNSLTQLDNLLAFTKLSTDKLGIRLYGNVETFDSTRDGNVPASEQRISNQLLIQKPYVEQFIAFSLNHFQNRNEITQVDNYEEYLGYYLSNR